MKRPVAAFPSYEKSTTPSRINTSPHVLCTACRSIFYNPLRAEYQEYGQGWKEIQRNQNSCYICGELDKCDKETTESFPIIFQVLSTNEGVSVLRFASDWNGIPANFLDFLLVPEIDFDARHPFLFGDNDLEAVTQLESSTASSTVWKNISRWLEACSAKTHPRCHTTPWSTSLPKRLLSIKDPKNIQLVNTKDLNQGATNSHIAYVTLSHCWGKKVPLTLSGETSQTLFHGFDEFTLPKTFRDAVLVSRQLDISFIWIDSLCIMQDDPKDWLEESQKMADVYSGAYCNIAATGAHDSSDGLFFERNVEKTRACHAKCLPGAQSDGPKGYLVFAPRCYEMDDDAPLLHRGWIVQERVLSKRTIHFFRNLVFWECSHMHACEYFPTRVPVERRTSGYYKPEEPNRGKQVTGLKFASHNDPWNAIVELYAQCQLTFAKDKLPAISGIANLLSRAGLHGDYIAGLWTKDIFRHLTWRKHLESMKKPDFYRAPSWSWASLDGQIAYSGFEEYITANNVHVLELPGRPVDVSVGKFGAQVLPIRFEAPLYRVELDREGDGPLWPATVCEGVRGEVQFHVLFDVDSSANEARDYMYVLPLMNNKYPGESTRMICGLLIEPTGGKRGEFRRLGHAEALVKLVGDEDSIVLNAQQICHEHFESLRTVADEKIGYVYTLSIV